MNPIVENIMALADEYADGATEILRLYYEPWHERAHRDVVFEQARKDKEALRAAIELALGQGAVGEVTWRPNVPGAIAKVRWFNDTPAIGTLLYTAPQPQPEQEPTKQLRRIHPLDVPLEVFLADLTTRPANVIRAEMRGLFDDPLTVRHLCMFSKSEMQRWPSFGKKCLNEVCELLRARGLQLWDNHDERSLRLLREHQEYFK